MTTPPRSAPRGAISLILALTGCFGAAGYRGPVSDHFDGERFFNQRPIVKHGFGDFIAWQVSADEGPWEEQDGPVGPPPPRRVGPGELRVTFVNHATMLLQLDGKNVLTDPIWSDHTSPVQGVGPGRWRPPGIRFEDLPPIDAVVISHNHYDHCDLPTLERLEEAYQPRFFVGLGNRVLLEDAGLGDVVELDWWQEADVGRLPVMAVPAQHFSGRGVDDRDNTLWVGWVLRGAGGPVYFAGDTGRGPHFHQIRRRVGPPRLAVLPIGAYLPRWFMEPIHIDPAEAVEAHQQLGAFRSVAMHFDTFALADEAMGQAPRELRAATEAAGVDDETFWVLAFGEGRDVPSPTVAAPPEPR